MNYMTAQDQEQADSDAVRKAAEVLKHCRSAERDARRALADAIKQTAYANDRHRKLFFEAEARAVQRRKAGLIEMTAQGW